MIKFFAGVVATLAILGIAVGGFYLGTVQRSVVIQNPNTSQSIQGEKTTQGKDSSRVSPTVDKKKTSEFTDSSATTTAINLAIKNKAYGDLGNYMADTVVVTFYSTECCGKLSKTKATEQLAYLNSAIPPWSFDENNSIATSLKTQDSSAFSSDAIIGTSSNRYVVAFKLNSKYLIEKITLAPDYKLILPQ